MMRTLEFEITDTRLAKAVSCDFKHIVRNSVNFLQCLFRFDGTWNGFAKVVVFVAGFNEYPLLLGEENKCTIPPEVTMREEFEIYLVGKSKDGIVQRTQRVKIEQEV